MRPAAVLCLILICAAATSAQSPIDDQSSNFQTQTLLDGLDNPTGVALRPTQAKKGPYELLFCESGAGRVCRVRTDSLDPRQGDAVRDVVTGFPVGTFGQQPSYAVGPLAVGFVSRSKIVVSAKGESPQADLLSGYSLPSDSNPLEAADSKYQLGPVDSDLAATIDDLQLGGLAISDHACFVTSGGAKGQGWVFKASSEANRLVDFRSFIDLPKLRSVGGPAGLALVPKPRPEFLVVGMMGSREANADSRIVFFVPSTGELALDLPTGLNDIIGLAYSPSGQLYAADFSWRDAAAGGVYRLDDARIDGQQACRAVKIASIVRPFALAFTPDGSLYVTAFGDGENTKQGQLIKVTGNL